MSLNIPLNVKNPSVLDLMLPGIVILRICFMDPRMIAWLNQYNEGLIIIFRRIDEGVMTQKLIRVERGVNNLEQNHGLTMDFPDVRRIVEVVWPRYARGVTLPVLDIEVGRDGKYRTSNVFIVQDPRLDNQQIQCCLNCGAVLGVGCRGWEECARREGPPAPAPPDENAIVVKFE